MSQQADIFDALTKTHMHTIGASGFGKSKFLQWLLRYRIENRLGFAVVDWHGTLFDAILADLAYFNTKQKVYILDPSQGDLVQGFNPFSGSDGEISVMVSRRIDAIMKAWGAENADETPQLSEVLRMVLHFAAETRETLPNAAALLKPANRDLRQYAARVAHDPYMREKLADFATWTDTFLRQYAGSTVRRLDRFLALTAIRRMLGRSDPKANLDIARIVDEKAILLVNLASSKRTDGGGGFGHLSSEAGKLIATLLLDQFIECALARAGTSKRFVLVLDEFQQYVTGDIGGMLDQARKGGVSLVLSHHHMKQFGKDDALATSLLINAQLKFIFGGADFDTASLFAKELFLSQINARKVEWRSVNPTTVAHVVQKLKNYGSTATHSETETPSEGESKITKGHDEEPNATTTTTSLSKATGDSTGSSVSDAHLLLPILKDRVQSEQATDWQTKVSQQAQRIKELDERETFIKAPGEEGAFFRVPLVRDYTTGLRKAPTYRVAVMQVNHALPPAEIDVITNRSQKAFMEKCRDTPDRPTTKASSRPKLV